uniref:Aurein-4.4 n=2 Tax=Ranoidea TaxID=2777416 RepID=AUR44_RANAE|nr:RecName: Full=Aurein-4.4 [Ranoidea raniformis]P69027.1 RecName: Full=Aurein-4.4 [Ranoidea aurea]
GLLQTIKEKLKELATGLVIGVQS